MVYYFYYARRLKDDVYQLPTTFCGHLPISFSLGVAFKKAFSSYIKQDVAPLRAAYQETKNTSDVSCVSCWVGDYDSASSQICFVLQVLTCMVRYLSLIPFETEICTRRCTVIKHVEERKRISHTP